MARHQDDRDQDEAWLDENVRKLSGLRLDDVAAELGLLGANPGDHSRALAQLEQNLEHDPAPLALSPEEFVSRIQSTLALTGDGGQRCLSQPILRMRAEDLPDTWTPDLFGVWTLLRRLLDYVGLGDHSVRLDDGRAGRDGFGDQLSGQLTYVGLADAADSAGKPVLEFWIGAIGAPESMLGPACFAVAGAWLHELRRRGQQDHYRAAPLEPEAAFPDEAEAAIAAQCLGFGVVLANAAYDPRSIGDMQGLMERTAWVTQSLGLPLELTTWGFALWLTLTSTPEAEAVEYRRALRITQQRIFDDAWAELQHPPEVAAQWRALAGLGDTPPPPRRSFEVRDISDPKLKAELAVYEAQALDAQRFFNRGRAVARVVQRPTGMLTALGSVAAIATCVAMQAALPGLLLPLVGAAAAQLLKGYRCSDPECEVALDREDKVCPRCGGSIVVDIKNPRERLAAIEAWQDEGGTLPSPDAD